MNDRDRRREYHPPIRVATQMPVQRASAPPLQLPDEEWPDGIPRGIDEEDDISIPHADEPALERLERVGRRTEKRAKRQSEHLGIIVGLFKAEMEERRAERKAHLEAKKVGGDRMFKVVMYVLGVLATLALGLSAGAGILR